MADQHRDQQDHPPEKKVTHRRSTLQSHTTITSVKSFLRRGQKESKSGPVQDHIPCYDDLHWEDVRDYLESMFPGWNFHESKSDDQWTFVVPRKLTSKEKQSIKDLKEKGDQRRPSISDSE